MQESLKLCAAILTVAVPMPLAYAVPASPKSYDPIPPAWNKRMSLTGMLMMGAQYCTQQGQCHTVGLDHAPIVVDGIARNALEACRAQPEIEECRKASLPVDIVAMSQAGSVIVALNGRNYAVAGIQWSREEPDGSFIGGPITVNAKDESIPLQLYLMGQSRQTTLAAREALKERRKKTLAGILRIKREPCDELIDIFQSPVGMWLISCKVGGTEVHYQESVSNMP